jgi:hypothetical protein
MQAKKKPKNKLNGIILKLAKLLLQPVRCAKIRRKLSVRYGRRHAAEKKIQHAVDAQARKELRIAQRAAKNAAKLQRKDQIPPAKITVE